MAQCRSCNAEIILIKTVNDKFMPCDPELYNCQDDLVNLDMIVTNKNGQTGKLRTVESGYISHFSTCPQANTWRKR